MSRQLKDRLAALHVEISDSTAERHRAAISEELKAPAAPARHQRSRRVRTTSLVATAMLLALPAAAIAAESSVPGDILHPVKLATEQVLLIIDPNIDTEHRIEELEIVVDRQAPIDEVLDRLADADEASSGKDVPDELVARLQVARDRISDEYGSTADSPTTDERPDQTGRPPSDVTRPDRQTSTTTPSVATTIPEVDEPRDVTSTTTSAPPSDRPPRDTTTTTAPPRDGDAPPRDARG